MPVVWGLFPFTFDGARDLLWVKNQIDFKRPSLVGPWASAQGVYFGPLWYWLLTLPYLIGGGSPVAIAVFNWIIVFLAVFVMGLLLRKISKNLAFFALFLGIVSPAIHGISQYAFSQHLLPFLTILLIYSYFKILQSSSKKHFLLAVFLISLMFHAEPPISIISLPSLAIIIWLANKKKKMLDIKMFLRGLLFFCIPFLPLVVFDLRHEFIQLKSITAFVKGDGVEIVRVGLGQRIIDVLFYFFDIFRITILQRPKSVTFFVLLLALGVNLFLTKGKTKKLWQAGLIYVLSLMFVLIVYQPLELKNFYLDGVIMIFVIWTGIAAATIWEEKRLRPIIFIFLIFSFFINSSPIYFVKSLSSGFADKYELGSIFVNRGRTVDWIYEDAGSRGFKVYSYLPDIYDYPYQYLFFWKGLKEYGYLPEEFAYLPDQPEYVEKKSLQLDRVEDKIKKSDGLVYLIYERGEIDEFFEKWYNNFSRENMQLVEKRDFMGGITVEERKVIDL